MVRGFIGVVHLPALPGDARHSGAGSFADAVAYALRDAETLASGGVDGLLVENFGSAPFVKGTGNQRIPPHQAATLAVVARECAQTLEVPVGVNCLRSDAMTALGIAAACELDFVRVNVHTGAYLTDQGLVEGEAHLTLPYRKRLGAEHVEILADVLVKHASPVGDADPTHATRDTLERGLADGVIVTGKATGEPVDRQLLEEVGRAAGAAPVFVGSGVTPDNARELAAHADGVIVGNWLKQDNDLYAPVDEAKVRKLREVLSGAFGRTG